MRLCTFRVADGTRLGELRGDTVQPLAGRDVRDALGGVPAPDGDPLPLDGLELLAPMRPGKLLGIGLNFRDHAAETGAPVPERPLVFSKLATSVTGPRGDIVRPAYTRELDYEGELAVVIGRAARDVAAGEALGHVFGYAVMNDVSARDRQRTEPQWVRAKGGDTFGPFGPWVTTADEVPDPQALTIRTHVNGELRQEGSTSEMVFTVAELVAAISAGITLEPGDVVTTGTPAGVGVARAPQAFLVPGDVVRVEIDGLGALENAVR
ncbi:fumarylacetoacetate hydrolase family protein [Miltoncostaea marina]|uniref:fumarylacetoacetate hydrolase family protein n=1 Tax=Miltoncostaea marina TaxID=2843215 RepID=UPI001C3D4DE9|nr:fumarylacetoacetate hydrolase family protein [Miltoncostaea marina]